MNFGFIKPLVGTILISVLASLPLVAQNVEKLYEQGESLFYKEKFEQAMPFFVQASEADPTYKDSGYKAEICSLLLVKYREKPLAKMIGYSETMKTQDKFHYYWMGRIYANRYMFPEAVDAWKTFLNRKDAKSMEIIDETKDFIKGSQKLVTYFDNPDNYEVFPLPAPINTPGPEMTPAYFTEKGELIYASPSTSKPGELAIYHSIKKGMEWGAPSEISILGTFTKENANIEVVNTDGRLFFFKDLKGGDLFYSQPGNNGWVTPVEFDSKISSTHLASHFYINEHEDRIIFASDLNKKQGLDLYESFRDAETGKWGKPTPFSDRINTEWDEDSPYLSKDEKRLYFTSNRPNGVGGLDIYVSFYDAEKLVWSRPENMGWPINSPDDDIQLKINEDLESGYFVSNRIHSTGDFDIFFFWQIEKAFVEGRVINAIENKPLSNGEIRFHPSKYLDEYFRSKVDETGRYRAQVISDEIFRVEIISGIDTLSIEQFEIHDAKGETITHFKDFTFIPSTATPEQVAAYQKNLAAAQVVTAPVASTPPTQKQPEAKPITTPAPDKTTPAPTTARAVEPAKKPEPTRPAPAQTKPAEQPAKPISTKPAMLSNYKTGDKAILHNVYFDAGTSQLTSGSTEVLKELLQFLRSNPTARVEISGHTDNVGSADVNQWLSQRRAESVANWLVKNGVDSARLVAKGYGESFPLASNDDEINGRELNRRIEVLIIK